MLGKSRALVKDPCFHFSSPSRLIAPVILFILVLLMFAEAIFPLGGKILSSPQTDIANQFIYWRDFGFRELKNGNLPLWNPHLFSGAPFFSGFQSALLYPLNLLFLFLPVALAINISIILHVFLLGVFTQLWARNRCHHPLAALLPGILIMFCGSYFLHIYAGHLSNLCTMAWIPLIFLSIDGLLDRPSLGWVLLGAFASSMQILAGHPQYVYYTGIAVLIYATSHVFMATGKRAIFSLLVILAMLTAGCAMSAVQMLPGIAVARESVRFGGLPYSFAAMFSFPPENLLTLITPYFFGDMNRLPYWGRAYLWEMNLFISITGLILAVYGIVRGGRSARLLAVTALILFILALGSHTPLFAILFGHFPWYDSFRGTSKFIFFVSIMLILLAGIGFDALLRERLPSDDSGNTVGKCHRGNGSFFSTQPNFVILLFSLLTAGLTLLLEFSASRVFLGEVWQYGFRWITGTGESYLDQLRFAEDTFITEAVSFATTQMALTALTLVAAAGLWRLALTKHRIALYGIFFLAVLEILFFAHNTMISFELKMIRNPALETFVSTIKDDERVLNLWQPNSALSLGTFDLWGYDPGISKRYAELISFTQRLDVKQASQNVRISRYHPLMNMLRLRYIIIPSDGEIRVQEVPGAMSRVNLVPNWQFLGDGEKILYELGQPEFNPRKRVLLEKIPSITQGTCTSQGSVKVMSSTTDDLIVRASIECPGILLITDNYSTGWHAKSLNEKRREPYQIIRANYTLMAIPLDKGDHTIRLYYRPSSFVVGAAISVISWVLFALLFIYWVKTRSGFKRF